MRLETPGCFAVFGVKGLGEATLLPTPPAIINAVSRAIGVRIRRTPANSGTNSGGDNGAVSENGLQVVLGRPIDHLLDSLYNPGGQLFYLMCRRQLQRAVRVHANGNA